MNSRDIEYLIHGLFDNNAARDPQGECRLSEALDLLGLLVDGVKSAAKFANTGLLTRDPGVLVKFKDGSEFQISIVQSRRGTDTCDDDE